MGKFLRVVPMIVVVALVLLSGTSIFAQNCAGKDGFTAKVCPGDDISQQEVQLYELVNKYRVANNLPAVRLSKALSMVANRRMIDLKNNVKMLTHSWSNCPYDINDKKTWPCVLDAPERFNSSYRGEGYETLYETSNNQVDPAAALAKWKASKLHNSIILNLDDFARTPWDEVGVAIDGHYASLWFGSPAGAAGGVSGSTMSFDKTAADLSKIVVFNGPTGSGAGSRWIGTSSDKKIRIEIAGSPSDLRRATITIDAKLDGNHLSTTAKETISTLLKSFFPEWTDLDGWFDQRAADVAADPTATRTKVVSGSTIEARSGLAGWLKVEIKPKNGGIMSF